MFIFNLMIKNVLADHNNHSVAHKIRRFHQLKISNILIIGEQEMKAHQVTLRRGKSVTTIDKAQLLDLLTTYRNVS
ncbi:His/Gly/Thr/Pro-type tRNA ligase C-terminal domain-containing protein [Xenorhabdus sp. SGI246]|uniref:His/Gly/Thr/Pro-type tRNA ligase C-terminal domain-containing protein n=1 Tax=Xenorhabdus sp. SGI246 TaxID=3158263 RepID=UPI00349F44D2